MGHVGAIRGAGRAWVEETTGARCSTAFLGDVYLRDEFDASITDLGGRTPNESSAGGTWGTSLGDRVFATNGNTGQVSVDTLATSGTGAHLFNLGRTDFCLSAILFVPTTPLGAVVLGFRVNPSTGLSQQDFSLGYSVRYSPATNTLAMRRNGLSISGVPDVNPPLAGGGNWLAIEAIVSGTTCMVFANGTLAFDFTLDTHLAETYIGITGSDPSGSGNTCRFECVYATQYPSCPGAIGEASLNSTRLAKINNVLPLTHSTPGTAFTLRCRWGRVGAVTALVEDAASITHAAALLNDAGTVLVGSQPVTTVHQNNQVGYGTCATMAPADTGLPSGAARMGMFLPGFYRNVDGATQDWTLTTYQEPVANPGAGITTAFGHNYFVAPSQVSSVAAISSPRAYPDSISTSFVAAHQPVRTSAGPTFALKQGGASKASVAGSWSGATASRSSLDIIDTTYAADLAGVELEVTSAASATFNSDPIYVFDAFPAGFRALSNGFESWDGVTVDSYFEADPRFTCDLHLQVDDDVFGVAKADADQRFQVDQSGFVWCKLVNARGEALQNIAVEQTLDPVAPGSNIGPVDGTTQADGYTNTSVDLTVSKPSGEWVWTVNTDPAGSHAAWTGAYLIGATDSVFMTAKKDYVSVLTGAGLSEAAGVDLSKHFSPGEDLLVGGAMFNNRSNDLMHPETASGFEPRFLIGRFRGDGKTEYLNDDLLTFTVLPDDADEGTIANDILLIRADTVISGADTRVWIRSIPGANTAAWPNPYRGIFVIVHMYDSDRAFYHEFIHLDPVGKENPHSGSEFDPTGLFK